MSAEGELRRVLFNELHGLHCSCDLTVKPLTTGGAEWMRKHKQIYNEQVDRVLEIVRANPLRGEQP
jgi:hypothetical protein